VQVPGCAQVRPALHHPAVPLGHGWVPTLIAHADCECVQSPEPHSANHRSGHNRLTDAQFAQGSASKPTMTLAASATSAEMSRSGIHCGTRSIMDPYAMGSRRRRPVSGSFCGTPTTGVRTPGRERISARAQVFLTLSARSAWNDKARRFRKEMSINGECPHRVRRPWGTMAGRAPGLAYVENPEGSSLPVDHSTNVPAGAVPAGVIEVSNSSPAPRQAALWPPGRRIWRGPGPGSTRTTGLGLQHESGHHVD